MNGGLLFIAAAVFSLVGVVDGLDALDGAQPTGGRQLQDTAGNGICIEVLKILGEQVEENQNEESLQV